MSSRLIVELAVGNYQSSQPRGTCCDWVERRTFAPLPSATAPSRSASRLQRQIELEALRLYGLLEHTSTLLCGTPTLPVGQREFAVEVAWDLPNLAPSATSLLDVAVAGCRVGDLADAVLVSSTRFIELDAIAWTTNTGRVMARNISPGATFDLAAATVSVAVTKRRIP